MKARPVISIFKVLITSILLFYFAGCYYYRVNTSIHPTSGAVSSVQLPGKNFVIHTDKTVFVLDSVVIGSDSVKGIHAGSYQLPFRNYDFPVANSSHRYWYHRGEKQVYNEVHLYLRNFTTIPGPFKPFSFSFNEIDRLDMYQKDAVLTGISWFFGVIGAAFAAYAVYVSVMLIAIMIGGGSCPYIYVNTADGFNFMGEIFSGAIYAPLERNDYLVLPGLKEEDGQYLLKMSNEQQQEIQHINLTELLVFDHPRNSKILVDKYGKYQMAHIPDIPIRAVNFCGEDILELVGTKDSISYCGLLPDNDVPLTDGIIMTFNIPDGIHSGKLFIRARNSLWLEHAFKEMFGLFGNYQDNWIKRKNNSDPEKLHRWLLKQKIPLSVYIERNGKWDFCDFFYPAGPMALKEDVLPVDLDGINGDSVKIKLESGSHFWEIDYTGLDFSANLPLKMTVVKTGRAVTENGEDVSDLLIRTDSLYYLQPEKNNVAFLSFPVPSGSDSERTVILHSSGYYQITTESHGFPHLAKLSRFRNPDYFPEYSRELMKSAICELKKQGMLVMLPESGRK